MFFEFQDGSIVNLQEIFFLSEFFPSSAKKPRDGKAGFYLSSIRDPSREFWMTYTEKDYMTADRDYRELKQKLQGLK